VSPIGSAATKAAIAGGAIALVLFRTRKLPREESGIVRAPIWPSLLLTAVYLAWMFLTDATLHWRGPWNWQPWIEAPLLASALRVLAVCILGPTAEELIFRGWFFGWLEPRIGAALTILVTAAGWAVLHYDYPWQVILVILVDGILLGLARWRTRSVFPPIVMHLLYNLYAIW
jgi:membrane protease YdiL (CAAX protease family)